MTRNKIKTLSIVFSFFIFVSNNFAYAATLATTQTTTSSGFTTTQTQQAAQTSQNLIDSQNALLTLAATTTSPADSLIAALKASSAQVQNLNLLYGTSFNGSTGPTTSYDNSVMTSITSASGYNQMTYLASLQKTADLYRALQADSVRRPIFNTLYKTYLQAQGCPTTPDRNILFNVTSPSTYNQTTFLNSLVSSPPPPPPSTGSPVTNLINALKASSAQVQNLNLLYGTSFNGSTGPTTSYDNSVMTSITSASGYNQMTYLASLQKTADLYRALQADSVRRPIFNTLYKTYLQAQGCPTTPDRNILFNVTSPSTYNQTTFLNSLVSSPPPPPPSTGSPVTNLINALKASSAQVQNLNLLYGTSFNGSTGPTTSYDNSVMTSITSASGYNQTTYLASLQKTADLYRALQADSVRRPIFNTLYKTYLQAQGCPTTPDRNILFNVTSPSTYNQTTFLNSLSSTTPPPPTSSGTLFSSTSFWKTPVSMKAGVSANSVNLVNELIANTQLAAPWINTTQYSTPLYIATSTTAKVPVTIMQNGVPLTYTAIYAEAQKGVPIPTNAVPANGTDGTITIWDKSTDTLYEFWQLKKDASGKWTASWGGVLKNVSTSSGVMPVVTNSSGGQERWGATATGLPAIGGTMLIKELQSGVIGHMLAFAIPRPKNTYKSPATNSDGTNTAANAIPEGSMFKFPTNIYIDPSWSPMIKMMVTAVRDYGMVLRDKAGSATFFAEDPTQYGTSNPYTAFYGGLQLWDVIKQFPWAKLLALA